MARPESEPKTELAARLRALRKLLGDIERDEVAHEIGVSKSALASYERGETEPTASALAAYHRKFGANLEWIITGRGDPIEAAAKIDENLMEKLAHIVWSVYGEAKQKPPIGRVTREAAALYNTLRTDVPDLSDTELVEATIPKLRLQLKRRLEQASSEPGAGKRSA